MGKSSFISLIFAPLLMVSCTTMEINTVTAERDKEIYDECRYNLFYNALEGLSRAVKWQKISTIDDEPLRNYFMNMVFSAYECYEKGDVLHIGNLEYHRNGYNILVPGAVWNAGLAFDSDYEYSIECIGEGSWRIVFTMENFNSAFYAPSTATGDFFVQASDVPSIAEMEFVFVSGSGRIEDEMADDMGRRGVIDVYIEEPVNAFISDEGYDYHAHGISIEDEIESPFFDYYPYTLPVTIYKGAMSISVDVYGDSGFPSQFYYADLSMASRNEHIVKILHNGIWTSYVW